MTVKTTGGASPVLLKQGLYGMPNWSPLGDWITWNDGEQGWFLVSPDGKSTKTLGKIATPHLTFSKDGKLLYGMLYRDPSQASRLLLSSRWIQRP